LSGYPTNEKGLVRPDAYVLAARVNRTSTEIDKSGIEKHMMFSDNAGGLEATIDSANRQLHVAIDPSVAISSSNPNQYIVSPHGNSTERSILRQSIVTNSRNLHKLKNGYYGFALYVWSKYRLSDILSNIFAERKVMVDGTLTKRFPETVRKWVAVYDNLNSENQEDWSNAVHSCRRILKDISDVLFPASNGFVEASGKRYYFNDENYIVRLKEYIKQKASSGTFEDIIGSHLDFIGNRLDSIYQASTKGSHITVSRGEAERYVFLTYFLLSDLLRLVPEESSPPIEKSSDN
jgi:hypothetical protein